MLLSEQPSFYFSIYPSNNLTMLRIFAFLCIAISFISCSVDDDVSFRELNTNRQLWESSQVKNYSINERLSCFCGGVLERNIFVVNGMKDRVEFDETTLPAGQTYDDVFNAARTVEETFEFIESLLKQDLASLFIEYDDTYGFPKTISIDYSQGVSDDEIGYSYTNFEISN